MLDADLAALYGVDTRTLVQAVRRNVERFPADFMFQLTKPEFEDLRSQTVISSWGGRRYSSHLLWSTCRLSTACSGMTVETLCPWWRKCLFTRCVKPGIV